VTSLRFLPEQIEQWPLARLKPYERNPRLHSEEQVARLAASLIEYGWTQPILIADDGAVIAGHGRLLAAQHLGLSDVPVIRLKHLTETPVAGITKVAARQAFHVVGEQSTVRGAFNGALMRLDLVRILGSEPEMREDMVRVGMGTADIRYRAQFWPWHATVRVRFNRNVLSAAQIINLFNTAGFGVGIGEWRSEKDGQHGMFHAATADELRSLLGEAA
jgi:hypothetical protein